MNAEYKEIKGKKDARLTIIGEVALRDHFAGIAMQAMMYPEVDSSEFEHIAERAYEMADKMLDQRDCHP